MSEPSAIPSALGIEAVQWTAQAGGSLTVSVIGRWWRRRPSSGGQPQLVIDAGATRHRFPAMPEPPSLTGAAPGTWRFSFSVPAALAPQSGARVWLQFGSVIVSLAGPTGPPPRPEPPPASQREHSAVDGEVQRLEQELSQAVAELAKAERVRRIAEQHAHAERAVRTELAHELARVGAREEATRALAEAEDRIGQLEDELASLQRRMARRTVGRERAGRIRAEQEAARARRSPVFSERMARAALPSGVLEIERLMVGQRRFQARTPLLAPLLGLRGKLRKLRGEIDQDDRRRAQAERRVADAYDAIAVLREQLGSVSEIGTVAAPPASPPAVDPPSEPPLDAERFELALERLRQATPPREAQSTETPPEPEAEPRTWFGRLLRRLKGGAQSG
jgi:hypothetical protein